MINNSGFLIINKPSGPTSHDIVDKIRKITGIRKVGHAGTLDPFASGVLIVAVGREATREISRFVKMNKEYVATLFLGVETDTYDREGKKINTPLAKGVGGIFLSDIEKVLKTFLGKQKQIPPMYSAKKINGQKLYELARKGVEVRRQPGDIEIYKISIEDYRSPLLKIRVKCSTGTYIRSLAFDIGKKLGVGAYLEELERTAIGEIGIAQAIKLEELTSENWRQNFIDQDTDLEC